MKKFINGCRITIVSVTREKNESTSLATPTFLFFSYSLYVIKFTPGKFQQISISGTITDESP